jgi:hypothetical protein
VKCACEHGDEPSCSIKRWKVLGVAAQLATSQEGLSSMKLVMEESDDDIEVYGVWYGKVQVVTDRARMEYKKAL